MKPEIVKWARGVGYGGQKRVPKGSNKTAPGKKNKSPMAALKAKLGK